MVRQTVTNYFYRWLSYDRLLPKYLASKGMAFMHLFSKTPIGKQIAASNYDEKLVVATIFYNSSSINPRIFRY